MTQFRLIEENGWFKIQIKHNYWLIKGEWKTALLNDFNLDDKQNLCLMDYFRSLMFSNKTDAEKVYERIVSSDTLDCEMVNLILGYQEDFKEAVKILKTTE